MYNAKNIDWSPLTKYYVNLYSTGWYQPLWMKNILCNAVFDFLKTSTERNPVILAAVNDSTTCLSFFIVMRSYSLKWHNEGINKACYTQTGRFLPAFMLSIETDVYSKTCSKLFYILFSSIIGCI